MALLDEVATYLQDTVSAGTIGTSLFKGIMPTTPDVCVAVYEYGGLAPDHGFGTAAISVEYPRIQIVVRGAAQDYDGPRDRAETIYQALAKVANTTLSSTQYLSIDPIQSPFLLRRDANGRVEIVFNCQVIKGLSA